MQFDTSATADLKQGKTKADLEPEPGVSSEKKQRVS